MEQIERLDGWSYGSTPEQNVTAAKLNEIIDAVNALIPPEKLTIRINTHGNPVPECHGEWIDLRTAEDVYLQPLEYKRISLGVSMEMPAGYYALIVPRSSACEKYGVIMGNSMAVIENEYNGDDNVWGFSAVAIRETHIPKGTRICQFQLFKQAAPVEFDVVESLGNPGRGGWGSTGRD